MSHVFGQQTAAPNKKYAPRSTGRDLFSEVNGALPNARSFCERHLPGGRVVGREYEVRNPMRPDNKPGSFKINLQTCRWADFATHDKGGDLISLYAYLRGLTQIAAAKELAEELGIKP